MYTTVNLYVKIFHSAQAQAHYRSVNYRKGGNVRILETRNQNVLTDIIPRRRHKTPISDSVHMQKDMETYDTIWRLIVTID